MFVAHAHAVVPAPVAVVWRYFTVGADLACWFADSGDLHAGGPFRFSFGDGDFFTGVVSAWRPPHHLGLSWRFMGIGPTFDVRITLTSQGDSTGAAVNDSGAISPEDADSLRDGWQDFLSRLSTFAARGGRTRFLWSESIATGAILRGPVGRPAALVNADWLRRSFPGAVVDLHEQGDEVHLTFRDPAWDDLATTARLHATPVQGGVHLGVTHSGWPALAEARRFGERKRYAGLWCQALARLESTRA